MGKRGNSTRMSKRHSSSRTHHKSVVGNRVHGQGRHQVVNRTSKR